MTLEVSGRKTYIGHPLGEWDPPESWGETVPKTGDARSEGFTGLIPVEILKGEVYRSFKDDPYIYFDGVFEVFSSRFYLEPTLHWSICVSTRFLSSGPFYLHVQDKKWMLLLTFYLEREDALRIRKETRVRILVTYVRIFLWSKGMGIGCNGLTVSQRFNDRSHLLSTKLKWMKYLKIFTLIIKARDKCIFSQVI